jgi:23S rRNA pseudouridine2605 synthase
MRLAKYLASVGVASRRASETIVQAGRVTVDGAVVTDPARDVGPEDRIALDGAPVAGASERVVLAVHKPAGVVSTASDPQGRPTIVAMVPGFGRLYPVGRLDLDTTGLILLTNDGDFAHRMTHPSFEVDKTYRATVGRPPVRDRAVQALRHGVLLDDGPTAPARVRRLTPDTLEIVIHEGRKRQIRRMCDQVGHPVRALIRVGFGPLALGDLRPGVVRRLSAAEIERLLRAAGGSRRSPAASSGGSRRARRG